MRASIQPGGDDGCKIIRYESATSDMVEVEELLNDHEQALKDIGKLEHFEFISEQKRLVGGAAPAADDGSAAAAAAAAQTLLMRESAKMKMVKELLLSSTSGMRRRSAFHEIFLKTAQRVRIVFFVTLGPGTPCMAGICADVRTTVDDVIRIAAKKQQLDEASILLRKHVQVFEKRARAAIATLREVKHAFRPLWITIPVNHQIKVCVGSDTYGGNISCAARSRHPPVENLPPFHQLLPAA